MLSAKIRTKWIIGRTKWIFEYFSYLALVEYRTKWIRFKRGPGVGCKIKFQVFIVCKLQSIRLEALITNPIRHCWEKSTIQKCDKNHLFEQNIDWIGMYVGACAYPTLLHDLYLYGTMGPKPFFPQFHEIFVNLSILNPYNEISKRIIG